MIEALYRETRQIARTEEDNFSVELLGKIAAGAAIASDDEVSAATYNEQLNEFVKDHLQ
jgi:hypothetical protein